MVSARQRLVFLVDDDELWLRALARQLRARGLRCFTFTSPDTALASLDHHTPDLCVLDLMLGHGWSGATVASAIRARLGSRCPPLVLVSATVERLRPTDEALFDAIFGKQMETDALVAGIEASLANGGARTRSHVRLRRSAEADVDAQDAETRRR